MSIKVTKTSIKTLYHIQNMTLNEDGTPYNVYIYCEHFPNERDLQKVFNNEKWVQQLSEDEKEHCWNEWMRNSQIFEVFVTEI